MFIKDFQGLFLLIFFQAFKLSGESFPTFLDSILILFRGIPTRWIKFKTAVFLVICWKFVEETLLSL